MKSCVSINLKKDCVVLKLAEEAEQAAIISSLEKKLPELKKLYKDEKIPILVKGKTIKNREMDEINDLIKSHIDVEVVFDTPKALGLHIIRKTFNKEIATSETKFHRGSIRSGKKIEIEGSIVIIGDVNSGAEVIASENIVVVGKLRGLAHAGAKGNINAIIVASQIDTVQLRIANVVKEINRDEESVHIMATASLNNNSIIIG